MYMNRYEILEKEIKFLVPYLLSPKKGDTGIKYIKQEYFAVNFELITKLLELPTRIKIDELRIRSFYSSCDFNAKYFTGAVLTLKTQKSRYVRKERNFVLDLEEYLNFKKYFNKIGELTKRRHFEYIPYLKNKKLKIEIDTYYQNLSGLQTCEAEYIQDSALKHVKIAIKKYYGNFIDVTDIPIFKNIILSKYAQKTN